MPFEPYDHVYWNSPSGKVPSQIIKVWKHKARIETNKLERINVPLEELEPKYEQQSLFDMGQYAAPEQPISHWEWENQDSWNPAHFGETPRAIEDDGQGSIFFDDSIEPPDYDDYENINHWIQAWADWERANPELAKTFYPGNSKRVKHYHDDQKLGTILAINHNWAYVAWDHDPLIESCPLDELVREPELGNQDDAIAVREPELGNQDEEITVREPKVREPELGNQDEEITVREPTNREPTDREPKPTKPSIKAIQKAKEKGLKGTFEPKWIKNGWYWYLRFREPQTRTLKSKYLCKA